jgi:hypothetical protein
MKSCSHTPTATVVIVKIKKEIGLAKRVFSTLKIKKEKKCSVHEHTRKKRGSCKRYSPCSTDNLMRGGQGLDL